MSSRPAALSARAKQQLRVARDLIRNATLYYGLSPEAAPADDAGPVETQVAIAALSEPARAKLRGHVDWVSDYEATEAEQTAARPRPRITPE